MPDRAAQLIAECKRSGNFPDPMPEYLAGAFVGVSVTALRVKGVLSPKFAKYNGAATPGWSYQYTQAELCNVKMCLETCRTLSSNGIASPVDGHLFLIQRKLNSDATPSYSLTDFGIDEGKAFTLKAAAAKYEIPLARLRGAILRGEGKECRAKGYLDQMADEGPTIESIRIWAFGIVGGEHGGVILLFERDLELFVRQKRKVDRNIYKTPDELYELVKDDEDQPKVRLKIEVSQCASHWTKTGRLKSKSSISEFDGKVQEGWENGKRRGLKTIKRQRYSTLYHGAEFKALWKATDPHKFVQRMKSVVAAGKPAKEIDTELAQEGLVGSRLRRLTILAGVSRNKGDYIRTHRGPRPLRKRSKEGAGANWLRELLSDGPKYYPMIKDEASKKGISQPDEALKQIGGSSHHVYLRGSGRGMIRHAFYCLPGQQPPTDDEVKRIIAEHQREAAKVAKTTLNHDPAANTNPLDPRNSAPFQPTAALTTTASAEPTTPTLNKGGRPRSAEVEAVQAYIYERWIKGDKLAKIRAGAEATFGRDRAPKEDAHVTREAHRYAAKKSLPTDRNK
jgi:hypothetical protein